MLKNKLANMVKYNRFLLTMYRFFGSMLIGFLKLITPIKEKQILFMSFGGQRFDASPKAIYDSLKNDPFFADYKLIWAFVNPQEFKDCEVESVKTDTISFYRKAISSKIWVNNSSMQRGLNLGRQGIIEFNSWHGTPLKKMGDDIHCATPSLSNKKSPVVTYYCSQSDYDREIFSRFFKTDIENIIISDLPHNDVLLQPADEKVKALKAKLNIPEDKKVILYAPTYREFNRDALNCCYIKPPIDMEKWQRELSDDYVLLFRAHYEIVNVLCVTDNEFVRDVSNYPILTDLFLISDMLISDYSSTYFDYSILERPLLCFAYDYEEYQTKRGLYIKLEDFMPSGSRVNLDEDSLIDEIKSMDYDKYCKATSEFKKRFAPNAGNATNTVIDKMKETISELGR